MFWGDNFFLIVFQRQKLVFSVFNMQIKVTLKSMYHCNHFSVEDLNVDTGLMNIERHKMSKKGEREDYNAKRIEQK